MAVETGSSLMAQYVGWTEKLFKDDFGASAPADILFREFGFTVENVVEKL